MVFLYFVNLHLMGPPFEDSCGTLCLQGSVSKTMF